MSCRSPTNFDTKTAKTHGNAHKISVVLLDGRRENLPPDKNLAHYVDKRGPMNLLRFYQEYGEHYFPTPG